MLTIPDRECKFLGYLQRSDIEFIWLGDNFSIPIGEKRQALLELARGEYLCFVDDDDMITVNYVDEILKATEKGADCITFNVNYKSPDIQKPVYYSIKYKKDQNLPDSFLRIPNHLMPIKRELAQKVGFTKMGYGEDADFAKRVLPFLKTEVNIPLSLYTYDDNPKTSKSRYSPNRR